MVGRVLRLTNIEKERFLSRIGPPNDNGCQEWLGRVDRDGYGVFDIRRGTDDNGKELKYSLRANIVAWEVEYNEDFPDGMLSCHTCDNPPCCNAKDHLYPGTAKDNMVDRKVRGRYGGSDKRKDRKDRGMIKGSKIDKQLDEILKRSK